MSLSRPASAGVTALLLVQLAINAPVSGQCQGWLPGDGAPATYGTYRAATMFDADGAGPGVSELVVAGTFSGLGGPFSLINHIGRWDGVQWRAVPFQTLSGIAAINALAVFDLDGDGPNPARLIVGGRFELGFPPNRVQNVLAWGGGPYANLSDGLDGEVFAFHVFDADGDGPGAPELYAGGNFRRSGARTVGAVARWDGAAWQPVGSNIGGSVMSFATIDIDGPGPQPARLAAGGMFNLMNGSSNVAYFDGTAWQSFSNDFLVGAVTSLSVFDLDGAGENPPRLVAAGNFTRSQRGVALRGNAQFNGTDWRPIAPLASGSGQAITSFDPDDAGPATPRLILTGNFRLQNEPASSQIIEYRDGAWAKLNDNSYSGTVHSMQSLMLPGRSEPTLFLTGAFQRMLPTPEPLYLSTFEGDEVVPYPNGFDGNILDFTVANLNGTPTVIAGGWFSRASGVNAPRIAAFDGERWSSLGDNPPRSDGVQAVIAFDPDDDGPEPEIIVAGGTFDAVKGVPSYFVAKFDGTNWSSMGNVIDSTPEGFAAFDADGAGPLPKQLYASGGIIGGGPGTLGSIYRWNGKDWEALPQNFVSNVGPPQTSEMTTFDPDGDGPAPRQLVVVGSFNRVGNVTANNIAAFDGETWRALGSGFNTNPQALFTWDPNNDGNEVIVVGGAFTSAGGFSARGAAIWDGEVWSRIGSGFGAGSFSVNFPSDFCVFNGALHATGYFTIAEGGPADGIARWNGKSWEPITPGLRGDGLALEVLPGNGERADLLCVGGGLLSAGGLPNAFLAAYGDLGCCPADYNQNGDIDSNDFFIFIRDFMNGVNDADFNNDGALNSQDFFDFLRNFFAGC